MNKKTKRFIKGLYLESLKLMQNGFAVLAIVSVFYIFLLAVAWVLGAFIVSVGFIINNKLNICHDGSYSEVMGIGLLGICGGFILFEASRFFIRHISRIWREA
jgi:hypothetical protein